MTVQELEKLKKKIEQAKTEQIKLQTQIESIEQNLVELCGTSDLTEIEEILERQNNEVEELENKIQVALEKLEGC